MWRALVLGFAISAIVQGWVPHERIQNALGGSGARPMALAAGLGDAAALTHPGSGTPGLAADHSAWRADGRARERPRVARALRGQLIQQRLHATGVR